MKTLPLLFAAGIVLSASGVAWGQMIGPGMGPPGMAPPNVAPPNVDPMSVAPLADGSNPYQQLPFGGEFTLAPGEEMLSEPASDGETLVTGEYLIADSEQVDQRVPRYTGRFAVNLTMVDIELNDGDVNYWTDEPTTVSRSELALENACGFGARAQIWGVDREFRLDDDDRLDVRVASYFLDGYRRFVSENGELLLGGGLAFGSLKIDSPYLDSPRRFNGVGASLVGEGFYPFLRFTKTDIGVTGRARLAVLGPTEDNLDGSQAMLVDELGVGLELRRRFGKLEDKMWFVRAGYESQHWTDAELPLNIDQRLEGTSFAFGFAW